MDYDVAVVGAGPAGSTAAHHLASAGLRVALLERERLPRYKTCGGGVVGRALRHLPVAIGSVVQHECHRAEIRLWDLGLAVRSERAEPIVSMTMRDELDALLTQAAVSQGAALLSPCRVNTFQATGSGVTLGTTRGDVTARLVVAATGATGTVARVAGWRPNPAAMPALEWEMQVPEDVLGRFADTARFDFGIVPAGYAWVFPKRTHLSVGVLSTRRGFAGLRVCLDDYVRRMDIGEAQRVEQHGYVIPLAPLERPLVRNHTVLVGDALGVADPVTAEGISFAALSGELAAGAVLESGFDEAQVRKDYERRIRERVAPELATGRRLARILYRPGLRTPLFRHAGQQLCEVVTDVMSGTRTYREALVAALV